MLLWPEINITGSINVGNIVLYRELLWLDRPAPGPAESINSQISRNLCLLHLHSKQKVGRGQSHGY